MQTKEEAEGRDVKLSCGAKREFDLGENAVKKKKKKGGFVSREEKRERGGGHRMPSRRERKTSSPATRTEGEKRGRRV